MKAKFAKIGQCKNSATAFARTVKAFGIELPDMPGDEPAAEKQQ